MTIVPEYPKDSMRERTDARRRPTSSNGVEMDGYADMPWVARQSSPSRVPLNYWDNASIGRRSDSFCPSPSPSPTPNYYDPYMAAPPSTIRYNYIPTVLQHQIPSPYFWENNNNNISNNYSQTQTLPFPYATLPISEVTRLRHMITNQIQYYFSDDNLARDLFLKLSMDDEGWVPITLIAGFKRVRKLSKDAQFVRDSLIYSTTLEVQGERVRRGGCWKKWVMKIPEASRRELMMALYGIDRSQI